jgi:DNA-binding response OmpR family regulator
MPDVLRDTPLVMIAADNPGLCRMFAAVIKLMNCQPITAGNEIEVLDLLSVCIPDVLILDVNILDVLNQVRSNPHFKEMRVALLTDNLQALDISEASAVDIILIKPVNIPDLINAVKHLTDKQKVSL